MNATESALGLARKAGKCLAGTEICRKAIRSRKACLVFLDATAGRTTRESIEALARIHAIPLRVLDESIRLENALGKPNAKVAVITDPGFMKLFGGADQSSKVNSHGGAEKE
ncbi:MAG: 50S ribosomal protein L7ae [Clostridiales bacterium]|nr:50S ribosomal protein L7ae [Clostridiales bacterium]